MAHSRLLVCSIVLSVGVAFGQRSWTEFQATERSLETSATFNQSHRLVERVAWRADGSHVRIRDSSNGTPVSFRTVTDLNTGKEMVIHPGTESITSRGLSPQQIERLKVPPAQCVSLTGQPPVNPEKQRLLGLEVIKIIYNDPVPPALPDGSPAPLIYQERWAAPTLDCYPLLTTSIVTMQGREVSRKIVEVTEVALGPPASELFDIPANYTERSPSQVLTRMR